MTNLSTAEDKRLVAALRTAARQAGVKPDDPIAPLIGAFIRTVIFLGRRTARSDRVALYACRRIANTIDEAREFADSEAERFRAELAKTETDLVQRIAAEIVSTSEAAWTRRVRTFDRNTAFLAAIALFAVAIAGITTGAWWGGGRAYADVHETEQSLRAAFVEGPDIGRAWGDLMRWNSLRLALAHCAEPQHVRLQNGRRYCSVPLWLEAPKGAEGPRP